ncbi:hypothetical protein AKJ65_06390 [candidate division MSBL1 archaeon SCGC-AAA259E19]|uniref:Uncharacterized protein n=1 Tax=candidate division MSBL1 archaeon SCGC-AAA259E19 TaxID=1698264 RepID=A0A133UGP2_9EURY|nr:hypothetical protein AKJ65_06390 [candidate division MSBL1 archaeon SCGC-AAA259E19]
MKEKLERKLRSAADLIERASVLARADHPADVAELLEKAIERAEDVQLAQRRRARESRDYEPPKKGGPDVRGCLEEVESDIDDWTNQARRALRFHVGMIEISSKPLTLANILKALVDYQGFRRELIREAPLDSGVHRYFNREFKNVNPALVRSIAWKVAGSIENWFYKKGVLERVERPDLEENREGLKRRYQQFRDLEEHIEEFRR